MNKVLYWLYQPYKWLFFLPFVAVFTMLAALAAVLLAALLGGRRASLIVVPPWARVVVFFTPATVTVYGLEHIRRDQSYVVVANHESQFDIPVIYGWLRMDLKWVVKKELRKTPAVGMAVHHLEHIFVDRSQPDLARASINQAVSRLEDGQGVLFFAEGTRNLDGRLLPFKKGAFRLAVDLQMPILPLTVIGTRKILPARSLDLRPGRARLVVHEPIDTRGLAVDDVEPLMLRIRELIGTRLDPPL